MTDPTENELDQLKRSLFDAGREEIPSEQAEQSAREALDRIPLAASPAPKSTSLPWVVAGVVAVGAGIAFLGRPDSVPKTPAPSAFPSAKSTASLAEPPGSIFVPVENRSATAVESTATAASASAPRTIPRDPRTAAPPDEGDPLALELSMLDRARVDLRNGASREALLDLAQYEKRFPKGALKNEALLVKVEALVREERRDEAERLAKPFLENRKDEMMARRLEKLLRSGK